MINFSKKNVEYTLKKFLEENPGRFITKSCPDFKKNNTIKIWHKENLDGIPVKQEKMNEYELLECTD